MGRKLQTLITLLEKKLLHLPLVQYIVACITSRHDLWFQIQSWIWKGDYNLQWHGQI